MEENNYYNDVNMSFNNEKEAIAVKKDMRNAGLFFLLLIILEFPVGIGIGVVQMFFPKDSEILVSVLITQGYLLVAAWIFMLITGKSYTRDFNLKKYKLSSFFLSLLVMLCAAPMAICLNVLSQLFVKNQTSAAIFEITNKVPWWLGIIIIGCLPGFVEETIYRGIMFSAFRKYSILAGVVISAVSFGLMHLNFNQMPYAIYLGLIFAFMVEATGSITSTMVMHMIFNAFNTAYLYILPALYGKLKELGATQTDMSIEELVNKTPEPSEIFALLKGLFPLAVIGVVLVILIIAKIAEINGRSFSRESICGVNESAKGQKPIGVLLILGWIVCLIMSVVNLLFS